MVCHSILPGLLNFMQNDLLQEFRESPSTAEDNLVVKFQKAMNEISGKLNHKKLSRTEETEELEEIKGTDKRKYIIDMTSCCPKDSSNACVLREELIHLYALSTGEGELCGNESQSLRKRLRNKTPKSQELQEKVSWKKEDSEEE